jgi:hypothetical protein
LELTYDRADQDDGHSIEGATNPDLQQLPNTSFAQDESLGDFVTRKFAVLQELTEIMDTYNRHLVTMAPSMREAQSASESDDVSDDGEDVSGGSPIHSKRGKRSKKTDKTYQRLKSTVVQLMPGVNAWKMSNEKSEHMSPVRDYSVTLDTPPRLGRAMDKNQVKTTILEFIPAANAWKVSDADSEHMSPARGSSCALNITPPRVRRALDMKAMKKDAWKQAILQFRATHGTSD